MAKLEVIYGLHSVQAVLKTAPHRINEILVLQGRQDQRLQKILNGAEQNEITVRQASRKEMDKLAAEGNHQGVIAYSFPGDIYDEQFLYKTIETLTEPAFFLVLDGITDPHNLGACLRTADAAGVHAVIAPKDNSASITPITRKVACGAAEILPYVTVTNLSRTLKKMQELGVWIIGTAGEAEQSVYQADLKGGLALVMGAEGKGMRRLTREGCDGLINIPMAGEVSSLNVSVATGVCLFEALRQRS